MCEKAKIPRATVVRRYPGIAAMTFLILIMFGTNGIAQQDAVDIQMTCDGQHDTIWGYSSCSFDVYIANSYALGGMALGFKFLSPDGAAWEWLAQPGGHGVTTQSVTIVPFSRLDPNGDGSAMDVFDMTGLLVTEVNIDEIGRDTLQIGGVSLISSMATGPLQHMYSHNARIVNFFDYGDVRTFCMDSCFIPPSGAFVFENTIGQASTPSCLWSVGGKCWPVKRWVPPCGDANGDGDVNVGDAVFLISYVFKGGLSPDPLWVGDANSDGGVNVGDAVYLIAYVFKGGSPPGTDCKYPVCPPTVTDIDGNVYQTIKIRDQCWMAENLKVTHYCNGDAIPNVKDASTWPGLSTGAYCDYNNDEGQVALYGRLYNWYAINDSRRITPQGWHVASDAEWKELETNLGMSQFQVDVTGWRGTIEGGKLKEIGTSHWKEPNTGATNETGFTALPGGYRDFVGAFLDINTDARFWARALVSAPSAWYRGLNYNRSTIYRYEVDKKNGFSVRCVKD